MEDAMEGTLEPDELEDDVQLEVDKVLSEITADKNAAKKPSLKVLYMYKCGRTARGN